MIVETNHIEYEQLAPIWRRSTRVTHHFMAKADLRYVESKLPELFENINKFYLYYINDRLFGNKLVGFLGFNEPNIEVVVVDPNYMRQIIGFALLDHLQNISSSLTVSINEQDTNAFDFYLKYDFRQIGRSELDSFGLYYSILHLQWNNK